MAARFAEYKVRTSLVCILIMVIVLMSSCAALVSGFVSTLSEMIVPTFTPSTNAVGSLLGGYASYTDLRIQDRWALVWTAMFSSFTESTEQSSKPNEVYRALRKMGVRMVNYESNHVEARTVRYNDGTTKYYPSYTINKYRVSDKEELHRLANLAMGMLTEQKDPEITAYWMEAFYEKLGSSTNAFYSYALIPYKDKISDFASKLFEYEKVLAHGPDLSAESAQYAMVYAKAYPAGYFLTFANARIQAELKTDAEIII